MSTDLLVAVLTPLCRRLRRDVIAYKDGKRIGKNERPLSFEDLKHHVDGTGYSRGLYLIEPGSSATRVAVLDLDSHKGEISWPEMMATAYDLSLKLEQQGLLASPWRSSGGHGIHLIVQWQNPQDAHSVRMLLTEIIFEAGFANGSGGIVNHQIEIFPKQDRVAEGRYGNLVWLPLGGGDDGRSVPLIALSPLVGEGFALGKRSSAIGYVWPLSQDVTVRDRPDHEPKAVPRPQDLELDKIWHTLEHIGFDAGDDYSYDRWLQVGFAIHWASQGSAKGLALWAAWSGRGASCPTWDELEMKWQSIRDDGTKTDNNAKVVTIKTLEHLAREGGWSEDISALFEPILGNENVLGEIEPLPAIAPVIHNVNDHMAIARKIVNERYLKDNAFCLWRNLSSGDWFRYKDAKYSRVVDEYITNDIRRYLSSAKKVVVTKKKKSKKDDPNAALDPQAEITVDFCPTMAQIAAVFGALKTVTAPNVLLSPPQWISVDSSGLPDRRKVNHIVLKDGILDLETRELLPHTPQFFSLNTLPYAWGADVPLPCPLWIKFLNEVFPDEGSIECLQEIIGYLLTSDTHLQKMFMIKGLPRSGKGTIERVIRAMLGQYNVAGTTFNQLGEDFGLWPLIDKTAVFISEARNTRGSMDNRMALAVERLLSISGEDEVLVNIKGGKYYEGRLGARVIVTANEVPAMGDSTGAFASRFITLTTQGSWLGREDGHLTSKLIAELPGILRWSLDGLERLRARGHFTQPASGQAVKEELADAQNPIRRFLKEICEYGAAAQGQSIRKQDLYDAYRFWFQENGIGYKPMAQNWFAKALQNAYRELSGKLLIEGRVNKTSSWEWYELRLLKSVN